VLPWKPDFMLLPRRQFFKNLSSISFHFCHNTSMKTLINPRRRALPSALAFVILAAFTTAFTTAFATAFAVVFAQTTSQTSPQTTSQAAPRIVSATVRVDGLTCSLCHLSVHKALKKLDFVSTLKPAIDEVSVALTFKPNANVSPDRLAEAIQGAGFSIGELTMSVEFPQAAPEQVSNGSHVPIGTALYHVIEPAKTVLAGVQTVRMIDKAFVNEAQHATWLGKITAPCYKTGVAGECCTPSAQSASPSRAAGSTVKSSSQRVYHITI
jgi:copper chaperone CopZ